MGLISGEGFWSPLIWLALAAGVGAIAWFIWSHGRREYKSGTEQDAPFLSGERSTEGMYVGGEHLYWGFVEGLRPIVERIRAFHTGFIGDYIGWFIVIMALAFIILALT